MCLCYWAEPSGVGDGLACLVVEWVVAAEYRTLETCERTTSLLGHETPRSGAVILEYSLAFFEKTQLTMILINSTLNSVRPGLLPRLARRERK